MKDNSLDGHRGKVALSDTTRNPVQTSSNSNGNSGGGKCDLKASPSTPVAGGGSTTATVTGTNNSTNNDGTATTNFDDDYNEWELGIGDLIIDLDADIEKTNERQNNSSAQQQQQTSSSQQHHGHHHHHHSGHHHHHHSHHQNGTLSVASPGASSSITASSSSTSATTFTFLEPQTSCSGNPAAAMSNSKSSRLVGGSGGSGGAINCATSNAGSSSSCVGSGVSANCNTNGVTTGSSSSGAVEHQATVDKGLKMKIKRKTVGSKYSEAKHEIVQSDTKTSAVSQHGVCENVSSSNSTNGAAGSNSSSNSTVIDTPKSKHSSGKGRNSSHREKKEKNRDKDKSSSARNNVCTPVASMEVNGVLGVMTPSLKISNTSVNISSPTTPVVGSNSSPIPQCGNSSTSALQTSRSTTVNNTTGNSGSGAANNSSESVQTLGSSVTQAISNSPPMPNLTLKLESKFSPSTPSVTVVKQEERSSSPPLKKIKLECSEKIEVENADSPIPPEMKDTSTCTSVGTITEPDCLGPCEPGTSVMLEGIVWQETEGGVLVVNVTWRGKTYVGTLLDCTKHDWAPPRFCESPTSDVDSKATKGRGKRGRGANNNSSDINTYDARNCVQSKLRNGKGRRTTINSNNFTVPSSPAKSDSGSSSSKRKGRPADLEIASSPSENKNSKRSRLQSRGTPPSTTTSVEFPQPSSPVLIVCPEPNCSKKYKHINGLRYHQTHAHSGSDGSKLDDANTEDSKDVTNSSDNEGSIQESMSVPPSPAMSFTNSASSPHPLSGKSSQNEALNSSTAPSLPENDPYCLTPDLSTLASVAISDSKVNTKSSCSSTKATSTTSASQHPIVSQELPVIVSSDVAKDSSSALPSASFTAVVSVPVTVTPVISVASSDVLSPSVPTATATSSVIHSSSALDTPIISPAVTVSIPTSHVVFNQGISVGVNSATTGTYTTTSTIAGHNSNSIPPSRTTVSATTFVPVPSVAVNAPVSSPTGAVPIMDKTKLKPQERPDKYKPKSPMPTTAVRPIVPAPSPQLITLSTNIPASHTSMNTGNHNLVTSSLKPIQPKPTILGEPSTINPALESLKKEKSKHKKKSKDKDRERKVGPISLSSTKLPSHPNEECEPLEIPSYPNLEAVPGSRDPLNAAATVPLSGTPHTSMSPLASQSKPPESSMDMPIGDDNINENIQSPAYSDISDANDTAPVLESEVSTCKEKDDKVGKSTPDTAQSPAANISAYGMYPYYSQPPYLLPSVSPQSSMQGTQTPSAAEKVESSKKLEQERIKENRPWSNPSGELIRERHAVEHEQTSKKTVRDEGSASSGVISSPASSAAPLQDYPVQQPYPYSYGYVQGYPYSVEPAYHMHLLDTDPHYKQQYKQYIEDQQRLYKEHQQQQQHNQQQQQQQQQQQHAHHHHQHQQQQHSQQHHSQHQSHHQSKIQHHSSLPKEERERSREHKERASMSEKMSSSGLHPDHVSKQHASVSFSSNKEHDLRELSEGRPPSLPTQTRGENSTPSATSSVSLKEKQNENHQILKENIELKSQMDDSKNKINQFEMAMLYERHREDVRRFYILHDRIIEQQQHKMEPGLHHHTHHHQTIQPHIQPVPSLSSSTSSSLKSHKDDLSSSISSHSKQSHYTESSRSSSVISPAKSDHMKTPSSHPHSTSSPKGNIRETSAATPKEYSSSSGSSRDSSLSKKDNSGNSSSSSKNSDRAESSREEKIKPEKTKIDIKTEPEGQKPTMETTGPPPPPTNAYAYLHPSYLQPPPPHFPHMPFEPAHAVYRSGLNPMIMSTPHYGSSPYVHSQLRYVPPGACEIPAHSQTSDPLGNKLHAPGPPKALELLHQVSQQYTTHKIHELQEHALMSPTPTSTPVSSSMPSTSSSTVSSKVSSTEPVMAVAKVEAGTGRESSRSPPTQRHLHTHHHTHVGVGYPIYDPYGVATNKSCL